MRMSQTLIPTLKEAPSEAEVPSHILMVRGGYLRKVAAGVYSFLPLGWRVVKKVERDHREELDRAGCSEVFLPAVIPAELWQQVGPLGEVRRAAPALQGPQGRRLRHRADARGGDLRAGA